MIDAPSCRSLANPRGRDVMPKAVPPSRTRRTRATLERDLREVEEAVDRERADQTVKSREALAQEEREVRETAADLSLDGVAQRTAALGLEVSKVLTGLSDQLTAEVKRLDDVRRAVALEQEELTRLHGRDVLASAREQLMEEFRQTKAQLDAEIRARQAEWQAQQDLRARQLKEQEEELRRQRQREREEYEYQKTLERKKEQDLHEEESKALDRTLKQRREALEREWAAREAALKEREQEFARLKAEVEQFPAQLQADVTRAVAEATRLAEDKAGQQRALSQKDRETDVQVAALRIAALEDLVGRQATQIESLQTRLEEARAQVREIAVQAIEGASGARTLAHINQIAMEQAKHRAPSS
jgi:colicin import membrane protein